MELGDHFPEHYTPPYSRQPEVSLNLDPHSEAPTMVPPVIPKSTPATLAYDRGFEEDQPPATVPIPTSLPVTPTASPREVPTPPEPAVRPERQDRPVRVDPVVNFNTMNEHTTPSIPWAPPRELRPDGDPTVREEVLAAIDAGGGQIPFGEYMEAALYGPGGYYSEGRAQFDAGYGADSSGDFFTMPEYSDDFSRALSVGVSAMSDAIGNQPFNLVELGAGTGRMTKDVLAAMRNEDPEVYAAANVYIADHGGMGARQRQVIGSSERAHAGSYAAMSTPEEHAQDLGKVFWIPGSALELELDNGRPTIVMSNEVPDAMRAEVVRNNSGVLEQKFVTVVNGELAERWLPLTEEIQDYIATYGAVIESGNEVAVSPAAVELQRSVSQLIKRGGWISVDYGGNGPKQSPNKPWTPQPTKISMGEPMGEWYERGAMRTYPTNYNPLQMPGELDLTHDPDFSVLRRVSAEEGMREAFYGPQAEFLRICGLPSVQDLELIRGAPGLSAASIRRIEKAQGATGGGSFRALVVTRGVDVDFSTPRTPLPGYREFYQ